MQIVEPELEQEVMLLSQRLRPDILTPLSWNLDFDSPSDCFPLAQFSNLQATALTAKLCVFSLYK